MQIKIGKKFISNKNKTYFIADIGANHDGSLIRAKKLIKLAAAAGADAAKFQHFKAETIVSDHGFKSLKRLSHQKKWKESIFQTYKKASINPNWTQILYKECKKYKIEFMTSPYDLNYVESVNRFLNAYKIGSGDITWHQIIEKISKKKKPVLLATGASNLKDVKLAVKKIQKSNNKIVLMQCNTNYTNEDNNISYLNLNVLKTFKKIFGNKCLYGLSDHTQGHLSVIAAVSLGARVIEKHFTDSNKRIGPDHKFAMNPKSWKLMVKETRKLERALGNGEKKIEKNEIDTVIAQRRSIRASKKILKGTQIKAEHLAYLRPCSIKGFKPYNFKKVIGSIANKNFEYGEEFNSNNLKKK